jgi:hypothetical protein
MLNYFFKVLSSPKKKFFVKENEEFLAIFRNILILEMKTSK